MRYAAAVPEYDVLTEIAPGILWLRTRLPFALDHINIWILDDGDCWTVIDAGVGNAATRALWEDLLAGPLAGRPVGRVLITHFHPDHIGQAGWLVEATGAPLLMSRTEWLMARMLALDTSEGFIEAGRRLDRAAGLAADLVQARAERGNLYRRAVTLPPASYTQIGAGDRLEAAGSSWEVIIGEGHAPEQVTLFSAGRQILIAADQLLPRITPVVGVWPNAPGGDPLGNFLRSIERYRHLPEDTLVLPSHGRPYRGPGVRIDELHEHHEERLGLTLELCREPATAVQIMRGLFTRELDLQHIGFAVAETLAHLNRLKNEGLLLREPDREGVWLYRRS